MIVTTEGVLLRAHPYGESSLILRFLTSDLGAVRAMARGVRRGGGKGRSPPATFDRGTLEISYRETRELQGWRSFAVAVPGRPLGSHVVRFAGGSLLAELVLAVPSEEPSPELYRATTRSLDRLAEVGERELAGEALAAGWRVMGVLGFTPSLQRCVRCSTPLEAEGMARFDAPGGGLRCPECSRDAAGPRVGPRARRDLSRLVEGRPPGDLERPAGHLRILEDFAVNHLELRGPLRSGRMLRQLLRAGPDR